jgi:hypothetical protein
MPVAKSAGVRRKGQLLNRVTHANKSIPIFQKEDSPQQHASLE